MSWLTGICGFGRTGKSLLDFCLTRDAGNTVVVYNDFPIDPDTEKFKEYLEAGVTFVIGKESFPQLHSVKKLILSPGIDGTDERFRFFRDNKIPVMSEIEFAAEFIEGKIIAVTGTNGKSTTVSLIHHILKYAGFDALLAGNIGLPLISVVDYISESTFVVVETSSFQLEEIDKFSPYISVLLNITPDHLDRHGSMEVYTEAKLNIFASQIKGAKSIINSNLSDLKLPGEGERLNFSNSADSDIYLKDGNVIVNSGEGNFQVSMKGNLLKGEHNDENVMVAVATAVLAGATPEKVEESLNSFKGLPHRMELIAEVNGTSFVNDSKATNIDSALKSLTGFERIVLILGGKDKSGDFTELREEIQNRCVGLLLIGDAAEKIETQLSEFSHMIHRVASLEEAVKTGYEIDGGKGGTVLLAPGCASFDMFRNFEHRGNSFREIVEKFREKIRG